jgi:MFS family permease
MFNYVDRVVLAQVEPHVENELLRDASDAKSSFGYLTTAFLFSYMFTAPIFGWLADRMSRWKLIGLAVIVWSLASGASGLASTFRLLFVTRLFVGIGEAAYGPAAPTIIADLFPVKRRGSVLAWFYMAIPVGSALGYGFAGYVASIWDWRYAFYFVVPPGVLLGLFCFLMPEPVRGAAETDEAAVGHPHSGGRVRLADYWTLLRTPSYLWNTAGMAAMTFAIGGVSVWMPAYIDQVNPTANTGRDGLIFGALTGLAGLSATLLGGIVADRLSARFGGAYFLVSATAMLLGFPLFLLALETPFPWTWLMIFLAEFCLFFNTGPTNTIIANVTHPSIRGTAYALNILIIHLLGDAASPPLIGELADRYHGDLKVGFQVVSLSILVGGICWLCGARYLERDTALAPTRITP